MLNNILVKPALWCVMVLLLNRAARAQSLSGLVLDSLGAPASFIPLALHNATDSSTVKGTSTGDRGHFIFERIQPGKYFINIKALGFRSKQSDVYTVDTLLNTDAGTIILQASAGSLNEVSVTAMKKLVEFKHGNITVNIENSPLAVGNTLYDLLSRLPTVAIIDDNISIQGRPGARILIDERLQQMAGQPLINLLKSIQASTVEKIEILKNPPAKYDAAGVGLISVKTKKLKITGFSGSASVGYQQGFYANQEAGLSLNYKGRSFAVFSSLNGGNYTSRYTSLFNKRISYDGVTTAFNQVTNEKSNTLYGSYNLAADWYLNKRNTVGLRFEGSHGDGVHDRHGVNNLSDGSLGYDQLMFNSLRPNAWNYTNYNLNAEHLFDTLGTVLRASFDYSPNEDLNRGDFENYFLDMAGNEQLPPKLFNSDNNLQFIIYSGKLDIEKQLNKTLKLEAGVKANHQNMTTNYIFNNKQPLTGEYSVDTALTSGFRYAEQINAAYFNLLKEYKKFSFQLGLRGENTDVKAGSIDNSVTFTRNYFNLFPMVSANYNPTTNHSYQFSYNRRISRPNYSSFNPYKYFVNLFVSVQGNPFLVPEYYQNLELTHGYKSSVYNTVAFSVGKNAFYGYPIQNDSTKETLMATGNLARCNYFSYSIFIQKEFVRWWTFTFNAGANYMNFRGQIDGRPYAETALQVNAYLNNQFNLPHAFKVELTTNYVAPMKVVIYQNNSRWMMELAIRKSFFHDKLSATVGINDIFYTWVVGNTVRYQNMDSDFTSTYDTRRFKVGLTCNFGKVKVQQRQTKSNQDEKKRLEH